MPPEFASRFVCSLYMSSFFFHISIYGSLSNNMIVHLFSRVRLGFKRLVLGWYNGVVANNRSVAHQVPKILVKELHC